MMTAPSHNHVFVFFFFFCGGGAQLHPGRCAHVTSSWRRPTLVAACDQARPYRLMISSSSTLPAHTSHSSPGDRFEPAAQQSLRPGMARRTGGAAGFFGSVGAVNGFSTSAAIGPIWCHGQSPVRFCGLRKRRRVRHRLWRDGDPLRVTELMLAGGPAATTRLSTARAAAPNGQRGIYAAHLLVAGGAGRPAGGGGDAS